MAAAGRRAALDIYRTHRDHIPLGIPDVAMPGMTGMGTCSRLREPDLTVSVPLSSGCSLDGAEPILSSAGEKAPSKNL